MASLVTALSASSSFLLGSRSRSEDIFFNKIPLGINTKKIEISKLRVRVKAMGGGVAKFKGTQMREKQLSEMIEKKVTEAKQVCEGDETSDECKVAWDEVEEVSQAKADLRRKLEKQDPLEYYCQDNPETDECRVYED